jgi:hypothetical protein
MLSLPPASAGFMLDSPFSPEDGSSMFLGNVGLSPNNTALTVRETILFIFTDFTTSNPE